MGCKVLKSISNYIFLTGVLSCTSAAIAGIIMPSIGVITGLALTGIAMVIALPFTYSLPRCLEKKKIQISSDPALNSFCVLIPRIGFVLLAILGAHAICAGNTSFSPFSLQEAYKFAGIYIGVGACLGICGLGVYTLLGGCIFAWKTGHNSTEHRWPQHRLRAE